MKIIFAIPTIFKESEKETHIKCLYKLAEQCEKSKFDYKIYISCNESNNKAFNNWNPNHKNIFKTTAGEKYQLSRSVNVVIDEITDEDYFCFISDDIIVNDDLWVSKFQKIYETKELNCGVLGVIPHTNSFVRHIDSRKLPLVIEQHKQPDGIQFLSTDRLREIGKFDEELLGDCQNSDYAINMLFHGYYNYKVNIGINHITRDFASKPLTGDSDEFSKMVLNARIRQKKKWNLQTGWRRGNVSIYEGWKKSKDGNKYEIDYSKDDNEY
jgi:hypothetical protein